MAYICYKYGLNPATSIVGHCFLDPQRKTDPVSGLMHSRRTYEQMLRDVVTEYNECTGANPKQYTFTSLTGKVKTNTKINIRKSEPTTKGLVAQTVAALVNLTFTGYVSDGESINGNSKWYRDANGNYFWSGGVTVINQN